jgi:hypothetical protein
MPVAPWRLIDGTGQSVGFTNGAGTSFANALGAQTYAVQISATGANCLVRINSPGTAATATKDALVKATDPPLVIGCAPGSTVSVWGLGAGTAYLAELSH